MCLHCYKVTGPSAYATQNLAGYKVVFGNTALHVEVYLMCGNSRELVKKIVFVFEVPCFPGHSLSRLPMLVFCDLGRQAGRQAGSTVHQIK
jgi:hypothetical protein